MNVWKNILLWVFTWFIMAKVIGKGKGKGIKEEKCIFGTFIYEKNGN